MTTVSALRVEARSLQEEGAARSAWVSWTVGSFAIPTSKLLSLKYAVQRTQEYHFNAGIGADT